jgi:hypothetical protein
MNKVNLEARLRTFDAFFSPKIVARMDDYKIAVLKTKGELVWHKQDDSDAQKDFRLCVWGLSSLACRCQISPRSGGFV